MRSSRTCFVTGCLVTLMSFAACSPADSGGGPNNNSSGGSGGNVDPARNGGATGTGGATSTGGTSGSGGGGGSTPVAGTGGRTGGSPGGTGGSSGTGGTPAVGSGGSGGGSDAGGNPDVPTRPAVLSYAKDIAPILQTACSPCHTTEAKAGYNWTYENLVTNSDVTGDVTALSPCGKPFAPGGANLPPGLMSNSGCNFPDLLKGPNRKRVVPGTDWDYSLLWLKISVQTEPLCVHKCGGEMPPAASGKKLSTFDRDTIKIWMQKGALP